MKKNISRLIDLDGLLTKEQACVELNISSPTLNRLLKDKKIEPIRVGNAVRFTPEIIQAYKAKQPKPSIV